MIKRTESLISRIFEEAFNRSNLVVDEAPAPNHHTHITIGGVPNNPQGLKLLIVMFSTAFPDLQCTVQDEINQGNKVAAYWIMRGT